MGKKFWIQGAIKKKGGLHRALNILEGKQIPEKKIEKASHAEGHLGKMARLAKTLSHLRGR